MFLLKVFEEETRIGLLTDTGRGSELAEVLGRYRIRVDVAIDVDETDRHVVIGEYEGLDISWPTMRRVLVMGARPQLPVMTGEEYERARVEAGVPKWGVDIDENTIPHESSLVPFSVDFTKGCFLGQELVARIDSRGGNVPRRLRHVSFDREVTAGSRLIKDDKDVGAVTSAAGHLGLGLVHRQAAVGDLVESNGSTGVVKNLPAENSE